MPAPPLALPLLLTLGACGLLAAASSLSPPSCDLPGSRDVRRVLQQIVLHGYTDGMRLGADCPLEPARDIYRLHEGAKQELAGARWRCRQCGKVFLGERWLDAHLLRRHPHLQLRTGNASCLADWHATLHAPLLLAYLDGVAGWATDPLPCRAQQAKAAQAACLALADGCFLGPGADAGGRGAREVAWLRRQHALMAHHLCPAHECDKRRKRSHLLAAAKAHRRHQASCGGPVAAAGALCLAAFWLLLWLVNSEGGAKSHTYRRLAAVRRRLAAAAEAGPLGGLPAWAVRRLVAGTASKPHQL